MRQFTTTETTAGVVTESGAAAPNTVPAKRGKFLPVGTALKLPANASSRHEDTAAAARTKIAPAGT